jgi:hypothetical protein
LRQSRLAPSFEVRPCAVTTQGRFVHGGPPEPEQRLLLYRTRKIAAHHRNQRLVGRVLEM